ncbi:peptidoglycan-binding domain-containing protein [Streptomyces yaanensis]|uniref:Peptidoglycan-binding domain-containing protein n=1 Tax=Streptomyces yaanensis TaxID=1142239 RepID=A0ABV7SI08_9ACTN|nr:peptidoglycan-binding domain-containing protein [Streptomyces sp. CGMCC 4.7035]WNC01589.1 peptidoglycan-binding domain-containing protein [Streptomyces sp. CGMCC 4.7035]
MNGTNGQACPECGAPRRPDGTPSCGCTRRASDALRDARTAEAAAAEDFDPLRIRPYVGLGAPTVDGETDAPAHDAAPDETMRLTAVPQEHTPDRAAAAETVSLAAVPDGTAAFSGAAAADETMRLGTVRDVPGTSASAGEEPPVPRRRRWTLLLAAGGAVVAVVAAAGFASGLFSYDPPERKAALPQDVRATLPEKSPSSGSSAPAARASASASASSSASGKPSPSASESPSPSSTSPSPSSSPTPSQAPTTAPAGGSPSPTPSSSHEQPIGPVLRRGDNNAEVKELQLRLTQIGLYSGPAKGRFDSQVENAVRNYQFSRGITGDEWGVYGPATRTKLESETTEP